MKVRLITKTIGIEDTEYSNKSIDEIVVGIARQSSSREINELFDEPHKLLRHCLLNQHWSIFNTVNLGFEIETTRSIGRQLLRHSWFPQEFSQRYAKVQEFEFTPLRKQSESNRQSSSETFNPWLTDIGGIAEDTVNYLLHDIDVTYNSMLKEGVAKESARQILPECAKSKLYFNGTIRIIPSVLNQRLHHTAQKEVRDVCELIKYEFIKHCPVISEMMYNFEDAYYIHIFERLVLEKYGIYQLIKQNGFKKIN